MTIIAENKGLSLRYVKLNFYLDVTSCELNFAYSLFIFLSSRCLKLLLIKNLLIYEFERTT
jgi:hypothetical protein